MTKEASSTTLQPKPFAEFLASHGGPFYELQARLHLLHAQSLKVRSRAVLFVALAWGMPLVLGLPDSLSLRDGSYITDLSAWARFFIAIAAFVLAERQVERGLRFKLGQFLEAPLLTPNSISPAAEPCRLPSERATWRRSSVLIALAAGAASYVALEAADTSSWALCGVDGIRLTAAGWWSTW